MPRRKINDLIVRWWNYLLRFFKFKRKILCVYYDCYNPAYSHIVWGSDNLPTHSYNLCEQHLQELWEKLNPLLKTNQCWCSLDKPK